MTLAQMSAVCPSALKKKNVFQKCVAFSAGKCGSCKSIKITVNKGNESVFTV